MKKGLIIFIVAVFVIMGIFVVTTQPQDNRRKIEVTDSVSNIEGLELQVFLVQSEDGQEYTFEINFTNNTKHNLTSTGTTCYYKQGENWKELRTTVTDKLLYGWGILCPESVDYADDEEVTNTYRYTISPLDEYDVSKDGEYKLEFCFDYFDGEEAGSAWVIWKQE